MSDSYGEPRAGQEAARLLSAAQDWLRTSAPHLAPVDAEGRTCSCPLCRAVAGVREADPEAVGRWVDAAVAAATSTLAAAGERLASPPTSADETSSGDHPDDTGSDDAGSDTGSAEPDRPRDEAGARQDEDGPRGVRRIPLEQQEPGDLDG